jgi:hypothetical protein
MQANLTTKEKFMNMEKLGIVSRAGNYFQSIEEPRKQRGFGLPLYTLCEYRADRTRNGTRYNSAFYIPSITRPRCSA